jgi:hypothetical protein
MSLKSMQKTKLSSVGISNRTGSLPQSILYPNALAGSPGQSASTSSQYLGGTRGFLFAVVAIFSLAGYLYHRREAANAAQKNITWSPFTGFLSSIRQLVSSTTSTATASHCVVELENFPEAYECSKFWWIRHELD